MEEIKESDFDFQKALELAVNIITYLSRNYKDFWILDLMERCKSENIPDYDTILNPSENRYIEADDQVLTRIVQTYDKELVVRNKTIIRVINTLNDDNNEAI